MRNSFPLLFLLLWVSGCASKSTPETAQRTPVVPKPYTRVSYADKGKVELQVSSRRFSRPNGKGPEIWLVGAMHIGEPAYYKLLQEELDGAKVVLFEGVNTGSHKRQAGGARMKLVPPVAEHSSTTNQPAKTPYSVQSKLASSLGLVFQLEAVDYDRTNFLNSDLSVSELQKIIAGEGPIEQGKSSGANQSFEQLLRIMDGNSLMGSIVRFGLEFIGSSPKLQAMTKLTFIETIGRLQGDMSDMRSLPLEMKRLLKVLIEARNKKVVSDLKVHLKELRRSRGAIAVFYGAGHMDNMEKLLANELDYYPVNEVWLNAFSVDLKKSGLTEDDARATRNMVDWQLKMMQGK